MNACHASIRMGGVQCLCCSSDPSRLTLEPCSSPKQAVFQSYGFHFTFALTEVHTIFTLLGMLVLARLGWFEMKQIPQSKLAQLAAAYVGYIVLCNLSLKVNTVGFYQASTGTRRVLHMPRYTCVCAVYNVSCPDKSICIKSVTLSI